MGIKKIKYIPVKKLPQETIKKYNLEGKEFAQITITNPNEGITVQGVKSPIEEARKAFKKKELQNFEL